MIRTYRASLLLASIALAVSPLANVAQTLQSTTGQWTLQLGKRTFLVLSLNPPNGQSGVVRGTLARPTHFQTEDAVSFSNIEGPTEVEAILASQWRANTLSFTVQNPKDASDTTKYLLTVKDDTDAELQLEDVPLAPLKLKRVSGIVSVSDDWRVGERYSPDDDAPSNPEMRKIFAEDQRVRQSYPNIDWASVSKSDAIRRAETMKLLNEGNLHSGEDFTWAAFIFQHGSGPDDFLLAHTLAVVAIRRGYSDATWIAAATLDRYLQSIKQPQIYGTQFLTPDGKVTTQDPYNSTLIPDSLRRQMKVPDLASQQGQRQQYDAQRHLENKITKP